MRKLILFCMAALLALFVAGCTAQEPVNENAQQTTQMAGSNTVVQDLQLKNLEGKSVSLKELYQDKPVYLNFWASWCPPCVAEMPHIQKLQKKYGDKINFVAITIDENQNDAIAFVKKSGLTMPIYTGDLELISQGYNLTAIPVSIIIDKKGIMVDKAVGGMDEERLEAFIQPLLNEK